MLTEFRNVRQIEEEGFRRWFVDEELDLIMWYRDSSQKEVLGFQLCYDKGHTQKALTWYKEKGFFHNRIDDGESSPFRNRTPILVADGQFAKESVILSFRRAAVGLEGRIVDFVVEVLGSYPA